jgi:GNAT superfamily N-acetyltransferase
MSTRYRVRAALPRDVPALPEIEVQAAARFPDEDLSPAQRAQAMPESAFAVAAQEGRLWVAVEEPRETPVGFAFARVVDGSAHLYEIDVHPEHGRMGLGSQLVECVIDWARDRGDAELSLTTFSHIPWNAPYYARLGFEPLAASEVGPEHKCLLEQEASNGLDPAKRVAMRLRLNRS